MIDYNSGQASVWVSNNTNKEGAICIVGEISNSSSAQTNTSLPECISVKPYSGVSKIILNFAGLNGTCPDGQVNCSFKAIAN